MAEPEPEVVEEARYPMRYRPVETKNDLWGQSLRSSSFLIDINFFPPGYSLLYAEMDVGCLGRRSPANHSDGSQCRNVPRRGQM